MKIKSGNKTRFVHQIDKKTYLISGESRFLKRSLNEPMDRVEFEGGPRLIVGCDFYGKGKIAKLEPADSEKDEKTVKVTLCETTS